MTRTESLLRIATGQTAAEVTADSMTPLDVSTLPVPRRSLSRAARPLSPVLAAAAIVAVVAIAVLASHRTPTGAGGGDTAGVPPYYVALTATGAPAASHPVNLTVRSTFTGRVIATVSAPRPYGTFNLVEGTASDRTFLVGAQVWNPGGGAAQPVNNIPQPVRLYLLHFDPATGGTSLTAAPIPQLNGEYLQEASISPDGSRVAVGYDSPVSGGYYETSIRIYDLPGGTEHTLSPSPAQIKQAGGLAMDRDNPATIAWTANDRTISFVWDTVAGDSVRVLNTGITGAGTLLSDSHPVLTVSGSGSGSSDFVCTSDPFLSANGSYILCGGYTFPRNPGNHGLDLFPKGPVTQGFGEFSATTGKLIAILGPRRAPLSLTRITSAAGDFTTVSNSDLPFLLWADPSASVLLGTENGHGVVVRDGRVQAIPWSSSITGTKGSQIPAIASW
jgi:hypothetical protein